MSRAASRGPESQLRAPSEDGGVLIAPPLRRLECLLNENRTIRQAWHGDIQGRSVAELARQARAEMLQAALAYTRQYRDVAIAPDASSQVFLAGHQPGLFHPGVWLKNFVLGSAARRHGAVAVNLLVDTDAVKTTSLAVPSGPRETPHIVSVPFDRTDPSVPYEECRVADLEMVCSFGKRAAEVIASLVPNPMVKDFWRLACERAKASGNLGLSLAQARHLVEGDWGLETLELPQSRVCATESFRWFVAHLLAHLPRFRTDYNETVGQYRRKHGIRSSAHPVPDLVERDDWLEAPFWLWTTANPRRRPLFCTNRKGQLVIAGGEGGETEIVLAPPGDGTTAVERLAALEAEGIKIRPRALITTLWARLALSDLFVHGIGGAKYDEVTDQLFDRFFGLRPPRLVVVSGTLLLPVPAFHVSAKEEEDLKQRLWQLRHHPEVFLGNGQTLADSAKGLIAEKRRWIATPQIPDNARERCRAIRRVNSALQPFVAAQRSETSERFHETERLLEAERLLRWREFSFCLHPAESLRRFFDFTLCNDGAICSNSLE